MLSLVYDLNSVAVTIERCVCFNVINDKNKKNISI